jgi:AraC family transcriptional regulator, regulatory protein of adaptative response / DNA-3-methyladenine glycosylase II
VLADSRQRKPSALAQDLGRAVSIEHLDFDQCYQATKSRDVRFDGLFIVGVRTTGVYCRPSCPSPVCPKPRNVTFFRTTAAAQEAGLRACKRCRPDAVPGSPEWDARADLTGRAMRCIADGVVDRVGVSGLARQLAVSERHLNRVLVEAVGAAPLALARSRRAHTARVLIEKTPLPFVQIAFAAGFTSVRQFNDTIKQTYAASPSEIRRGLPHREDESAPTLTLTLRARPPYDRSGVIDWLTERAVPCLEHVSDGVYRRSLVLPQGVGVVALEPQIDSVVARLRLESLADLAPAVSRCRRLFDLDADPAALGATLSADAVLGPLVEATPGLRVPGTVDPIETAVRAVLGQQVSLTAARTLTARLVSRFGQQLAAPDGEITHSFPSADVLAEADIESLGVPGARCDTLRGLARRIADGELVLDVGVDRALVESQLREVRGVGPWTADYIRMRALGDPDGFPASDLGLRRAAQQLGLPTDTRRLGQRTQAWRPWRSYAAHYLWRVNDAAPR